MSREVSDAVVVGVGGGPGDAGALRYAAEEAHRTGGELRLVHATPSYPPVPGVPVLSQEIIEAGEEILDDARRLAEAGSDVAIRTMRVTGPRIPALVSASDDARLLVVGREMRTGVERVLGAGTTAAVATHANVPVTVVPADWRASASAGPVVVGLKSHSHADELMGVAFREADARGVPIIVLHAWKLPDEYSDRIEIRSHVDEWTARGQALVEEVLAPWRRDYPEVQVVARVLHDYPAQALVATAEGASLVLLLRRLPLPVLGRHLGGTARAVIRHAPCPVEVVPAVASVQELPGLELEKSGALLR